MIDLRCCYVRLCVWHAATVDVVSIVAIVAAVAAVKILLYLLEQMWIGPVDGIGRNAQDEEQYD